MIKTGFVAATLEQDLLLQSGYGQWLTAAQLIKMSDVTAEVNKCIAATDCATQIKERREANRRLILDAARKADPKLVPQIVRLYQGGVVQLYQYRVYNNEFVHPLGRRILYVAK